MWIFLGSSTQRTHQDTFWVLHRELLLMNVSKTVSGIVLVLLWFCIIGKTIKTLGFHNITHLLDLSSLDMSFRGVFRTLSNIWRLLALHYFRKRLHFRYLRGLWIRLCHLRHKFSIFIWKQLEREHVPTNEWRVSLTDYSDEDRVFAGLKEYFADS